jgi:hypothetical protein
MIGSLLAIDFSSLLEHTECPPKYVHTHTSYSGIARRNIATVVTLCSDLLE